MLVLLLPLLSPTLPGSMGENPRDTGFVGLRYAEVTVLPKLSWEVPAAACLTILALTEELPGLVVPYAHMIF